MKLSQVRWTLELTDLSAGARAGFFLTFQSPQRVAGTMATAAAGGSG